MFRKLTRTVAAIAALSISLSGLGISPVQANDSVPTDGEYVCTTGALREVDDTSLAYTITNGVVSSAADCTGAVTIASGVTVIAESAFDGASGMTSVSIPASVTSIEGYAFYGASILMDVNFFGNAPTNVGEDAFFRTASGAKAIISATATGFGTEATWNGLVLQVLPANGEYVCTTGALLVDGDTSPTYTINNGVVSSAADCTGAVTIASGATAIAESAFEDASGITSMSIPASTTSIGSCDMAATSITVDSANPNYSSINGVLFNKAGNSLVSYPTANTAVSYSVPSSVTKIMYCAFYKARFLETVSIPNSVTSIEDWAFSVMPNVETITFASGSPITRIQDFVFTNNMNLNSIVLPSNLESIGGFAFDSNTSLTSITFPASVTSIGDYAFRGANSLTFITIPNAVTTIGIGAFLGATALTSIAIPAATTSIGAGALQGANALTEISVNSFSQSYSSIDGVLFDKSASVLFKYPAAKSGTSYEIPSSVTSIKGRSFENAASLTAISIPASVTDVEDFAFENATALTDFNFLGDAPTNLGADSFSGIAAGAIANISAGASGFGSGPTWNGLAINREALITNGNYVCTTGELDLEGQNSTYFIFEGVVSNGTGCSGAVVIPEGVVSIGVSAFESNPSITTVTIPASVTSIEHSAFYDTTALSEIYFVGNAPDSVGVEIFYGVPIGAKAYIKASATGFGNESTWNGLTIRRDYSDFMGTLNCETGVRLEVGDTSSFYMVENGVVTTGNACSGTVVIPDGVTSIGGSAFRGATALTSINIPEGVTSIGNNAFQEATALTSITIPSSVTSIGGAAFFGATSLSDVNFQGNAPTVGQMSMSFDNIANGAKAHVSDIATGFGTDPTWRGLILARYPTDGEYVCTTGVLQSDDTSPTYTITNRVVSNGSDCELAAVIPDGVTGIGTNAFNNAFSLTSIAIPASVTRIGESGFVSTTALQTVSFAPGSQLQFIDASAFEGAIALTSITIPAGVISIGNYAFYDAAKLTDVVFLGDAPTFGAQVFDFIAYDYDPAPEATFHISAAAEGFGNLSTWTTFNGGENKPIAFKLYLVAPPVNGTYVCTTGLLRAGSDTSEAFTIIDGVVKDGTSCSGAAVIPNGVREIGVEAFVGASLTSISIPSSVISIEDFAFQTAEYLQTVTFAQGSQLERIGNGAFNYAKAITSIVIPASVTSIGSQAFVSTENLETVTFAQGSQLEVIEPLAFSGTPKLFSITIPARVAYIGDDAFKYSAVSDFYFLGNAPSEVGPNAFRYAGIEAVVHIRSTATGFGTEPSWNFLVIDRAEPPADGIYVCATGMPWVPSPVSSLTYMIVETRATSGGSCNGTVVIPDGVTSIEDHAFYVSAITSISIPESVTSIGAFAFSGSSLLSSITIPSSVAYIGENVVRDTAVTSFTVDNYNEDYAAVDGVLFSKDLSTLISYPSGKSEVSYSIPASVTSIEHYAFDGATALTSITVPEGVTSIGVSAFYGATALTSITIPASVTSIGMEAFYRTTALRDIYFQGDAPEVGMFAFDGIANQAKAHITASATGFGTESTWNGLILQADIVLDGYYVCTTGLPRTNDDTSAAYAITNKVMSSGTGCIGDVVIPAGVTEIGAYAFNSSGITSISLPTSLEKIGNNAFESATYLGSITVPANVTNIGNYAFRDTFLESVTFAHDSQLTSIGSYAFAQTNLVSITIPEGVTTIGVSAFFRASSLTSITIPASVTSIGNFVFDSTASLATISVDPNNEIYSSLNGVLLNKSGTTLITYPAGKSESTYSIPEGVTSISGGAFFGAVSLTSITIPASVTTIESWAFEDASDLADVYFLGDAPAIVEEDAFSGMALGAEAHISFAATGFGNDPAWNFLFIDRAAPAIYAVTYESTGGTAVSAGTFTEGGSIQTAPVSTRAGYTLVGWAARENGDVVTFPYAPGATNDITLHAIWTQATTPVTPPTTTTKKTAISSYAAKFSVGSSVISQTGKTAIKKIVSKSGKDAKYTVTGVATKVAGVSDSRVKGLAKARAEKVKAYLIKLGVKKANITIKVKIVESGIASKTSILAKYLTS